MCRPNLAEPCPDYLPLKFVEEETIETTGEDGSFYVNRIGPPGVPQAPHPARRCSHLQ